MPIEGLENILSIPAEYKAATVAGVQAAASGIQKDMVSRVHVKGIASDGQRIDRGKGYSQPYGKRRAAGKVRKGTGKRQSAFVDLELTGHLRTSLVVQPTETGANIGYVGGTKDGLTAAAKMRFAERNKRWGAPQGRAVIQPTQSEIESNLDAALNDAYDKISSK